MTDGFAVNKGLRIAEVTGRFANALRPRTRGTCLGDVIWMRRVVLFSFDIFRTDPSW